MKALTAVWRYATGMGMNMNDYQRFPSAKLVKSTTSYSFKKNLIPDLFNQFNEENQIDLDQHLARQKTRSLLVIHDNQIVYENYYNGFHEDTINRSFSTAKSVFALLVGIALEEGKFSSLDDSIHNYLPAPPLFHSFSIRQGLNQLTGLKTVYSDAPWGEFPLGYYYPDQRQRLLKLTTQFEPGTKFQYSDAATGIIALALEHQYGKSIAELTQTKLWEPLGMEYDASWSLFEKEGLAQAAIGLNARSIDFAKIGQLMLQNGTWRGKSIVPQKWVEEIKRIDRNHPLLSNVHGKPGLYYRLHWWHLDRPNGKTVLTSVGHLGQYVLIYPDLKMVVVRNGSHMEHKDYNEIHYQRINLLAHLAEHADRQISSRRANTRGSMNHYENQRKKAAI